MVTKHGLFTDPTYVALGPARSIPGATKAERTPFYAGGSFRIGKVLSKEFCGPL